MRHVLELRSADLRTRNAMLSQELTKLERLEETFRAERLQTEKWGHELEAARSRLVATEAEIRGQAAHVATQQIASNAQQGDLRKAHDEANRLRQELIRQHKAKDQQAKALKSAVDVQADLQKQVDALRSQAGTLERELKLETHEAGADRQAMADLVAELEEYWVLWKIMTRQPASRIRAATPASAV